MPHTAIRFWLCNNVWGLLMFSVFILWLMFDLLFALSKDSFAVTYVNSCLNPFSPIWHFGRHLKSHLSLPWIFRKMQKMLKKRSKCVLPYFDTFTCFEVIIGVVITYHFWTMSMCLTLTFLESEQLLAYSIKTEHLFLNFQYIQQ